MKRRPIAMSQVVSAHLAMLGKEAAATGRGGQFIQALRIIKEALQSKPLLPAPSAFGCPEYHLPNMHLLGCSAVVAPLVVHFATPGESVNLNGAGESPVYVMRFELLS